MSENPELLEMIAKLMAQSRGVQERPGKPIEEHKFWKTQPVVKDLNVVSDHQPLDGPLEVKTTNDVSKTPAKLPAGFEWCVVDISDDKQMDELYDLLFNNYVEDLEELFRFKYSPSFLRWALTPPNYKKEYHIGIRASESKKLLAFISGIPAQLSVRNNVLDIVEINFLCVHKQLRSKRIAPTLIKEVTRVVNLQNVWQALFTAGAKIPTPVSTARYYHRVFNWQKLFDVEFAGLPPNSTPAKEIAKVALPSKIDLSGFRLMEAKDVLEVHALLNSYISKFTIHPKFSLDEINHWFLGKDKPVKSFVVEVNGQITDFISLYGLESSVLMQPRKHDSISVAYLFYYASTASKETLKQRLQLLVKAMMISVKNEYDVLNALSVMDNPLFINELLFKPGDGLLNYNLFNYKTETVNGGINGIELGEPGGVGVVML